jgi:hypothetical protein
MKGERVGSVRWADLGATVSSGEVGTGMAAFYAASTLDVGSRNLVRSWVPCMEHLIVEIYCGCFQSVESGARALELSLVSLSARVPGPNSVIDRGAVTKIGETSTPYLKSFFPPSRSVLLYELSMGCLRW